MSGGKRHEVHLCAEHAREAGYVLPDPNQMPKLVGQLMAAAASTISKSRKARAMPACGTCRLTFHQFKQSGLLGCGDCYKAFGDALAALIERTQNAAVHHVGKLPRRCGVALDLGPQRERLTRELEEAVKAEQYERAAKLRDRLRALERSAEHLGEEPSSEKDAESGSQEARRAPSGSEHGGEKG